MKINIISLDAIELNQHLQTLIGDPQKAKIITKQLWEWIYVKGITSFEAMSNIAKQNQAKLTDYFHIPQLAIANHQQSKDGTQKWVFQLHDKALIETVYIPEDTRGTLCISSQVGCTLTCAFCHTGTQRWVRNLTSDEIINQVMQAKRALNDFVHRDEESRRVTNIVFMGMGEPLFNFDSVKKACLTLLDSGGLAYSKRRVTLSTSGVVPLIGRVGEEIGCNLAISFHATTDEVRTKIMPINNKWKLSELITALQNYPSSPTRRITFEYVMLDGVNDSLEDAKRLVEIVKTMNGKVNLIPFNPWPGSPFKSTPLAKIKAFSDYIYNQQIPAPIRRSRGDDILAACGQLKSTTEKQPKYSSLD